jgi:hypothetical protein
MQRTSQVIRDAITRNPIHRSLNLTDRLAYAIDRSVSERERRIKRLIREYAEGRYQAYSPAVSKFILEEMLAAGHEAPDT